MSQTARLAMVSRPHPNGHLDHYVVWPKSKEC
jgi:hypothetical protein